MKIAQEIEAKAEANMPEALEFLRRVAAMSGVPFDEMRKRFCDGTLSEKLMGRLTEILMRGVTGEDLVRAKAEEIVDEKIASGEYFHVEGDFIIKACDLEVALKNGSIIRDGEGRLWNRDDAPVIRDLFRLCSPHGLSGGRAAALTLARREEANQQEHRKNDSYTAQRSPPKYASVGKPPVRMRMTCSASAHNRNVYLSRCGPRVCPR
jgi:hypothetical protein